MLEAAFAEVEERIGPVDSAVKEKQLPAILTSLTRAAGVPGTLLDELVTAEDPREVAHEALARIAGVPMEFSIHVQAGELAREKVLMSCSLQIVSQIILFVLGGEESGSRFSDIRQDLHDFYVLQRTKQEQKQLAVDTQEGIAAEPQGITLEGPEQQEVLSRYSRAIFSITASLKRIKRINTGQYL